MGGELMMMSCKCKELARRERRRCKEIVMAVMDRLVLEERICAQVSDNCFFCINFFLQILE